MLFLHRACGGRKLYRNLFRLSSPFVGLSTPPGFTHQPVFGLLSTGSAFITDRRWPCQVSFPHSFPWKGKARPASNEAGLLEKFRRRPTFPHSYPCSIIGAVGLNFCVRNGNRCDSYAIATENRTTGFQLPKTLSMRACWMETLWSRGARRTSPPSSRKNFLWSSLTVN